MLNYRRYMLEPVPQIMEAAKLLDAAAEAHLAGNRTEAARLIVAADMPEIAVWADKLWGKV